MKEEVKENSLHPTRWKLFWRIQKECWRRMITPYLMYLFMSILMLATQAISNTVLKIVLGSVCMLGGMAFNAHLLYSYGAIHFDAYLTGCLHRKNAAYGIVSGGDHRVEREYRWWKGFYIGFLVGIPVIIFGLLAGSYYGQTVGNAAGVFLIMFAGWAIIPISWLRVSFYWSLFMILIPVIVSGGFYILGAYREKRKKEMQAKRSEAVAAAAVAAKAELKEQTEEQRRKTLQSKKKKK